MICEELYEIRLLYGVGTIWYVKNYMWLDYNYIRRIGYESIWYYNYMIWYYSNAVYFVLWTVYCCTVYCILCIVCCIFCIVHCVLYTVYCVLYTSYCMLHTVYCILCAVYCIPCTVYCVLCTVLCTVYCTLCTVHCVLSTVYCCVFCFRANATGVQRNGIPERLCLSKRDRGAAKWPSREAVFAPGHRTALRSAAWARPGGRGRGG